jgi:hypothetical protein
VTDPEAVRIVGNRRRTAVHEFCPIDDRDAFGRKVRVGWRRKDADARWQVLRIQPGPATVTFEEPVDLIDPEDGEMVLTRGVMQWEPQCEVNDTAVVFYRLAAGR